VYEQFQRYQLLFLALLAVVIIGFIVRHVIRKRREEPAES
jgi:flagellar biosynthesis/type III secretory pathway M-ring protein FliF/YscJ